MIALLLFAFLPSVAFGICCSERCASCDCMMEFIVKLDQCDRNRVIDNVTFEIVYRKNDTFRPPSLISYYEVDNYQEGCQCTVLPFGCLCNWLGCRCSQANIVEGTPSLDNRFSSCVRCLQTWDKQSCDICYP